MISSEKAKNVSECTLNRKTHILMCSLYRFSNTRLICSAMDKSAAHGPQILVSWRLLVKTVSLGYWTG